jgi:hypothetical protein
MVRKIDPEIARAAEILVAAGYRWPTDNIEDLLLEIAAAAVAEKEAENILDLIRNCPDRVNPFAAPGFSSHLGLLWRSLSSP